MTYEYACAACGHQWEAEQSIKEAPLRKCPRCGRVKAKRQISAGTGFILKGGGWYSDGYGSPAKAKAGAKSQGEGAAASPKPSEGEAGGSKAPEPKTKPTKTTPSDESAA